MNSSNWDSLEDDEQRKAMVNTNMVVTCPMETNCTSLKSTPGANIASPVSMFLTGTIGNAVALLVLHRNSRREQMRTVFYLLVGSLVWTDLMGIVLTSIPVLVVYTNGRWVGSTGLCNYHAFTMISIGLITPCIVCTMAVERFLGIRHTYFYKRHVNRHRLRLVLLAQWIAVLLFTSLPFFGFGQYARQYPGTWCFFDMHATHVLHVAYAFCFAVFNVTLIVVIIVCNIAVIAALISMRHRRKHLSSPSRDRQVNRRCDRQREVEIQMVILLVGITVLFTTCWMPLMIQIILNQIIDYKNDHRQDLLAIRILSINQTFDPWIYILFRKVIFTKFWRFLRRIFIGKRVKIKRIHELDGDHKEAAPVLISPPTSALALPALTAHVPEHVNGAYCHNCESQYGDGVSSGEAEQSAKMRSMSASSNGESGGNCPSTAVVIRRVDDEHDGDDDDEDDDNDSALEAEEPNSSSAAETITTTTTTMPATATGRCHNCRQLINAFDVPVSGRGSSHVKSSWKPFKRPDALLSVKFLRKHSTKRSLPTASELSLNDNSRSVQSAVL